MRHGTAIVAAIVISTLPVDPLPELGASSDAHRKGGESCMRIVAPHQGQSIPCSGPDGEPCVTIYADDEGCAGTITEVTFQWSPSGFDPWFMIDDVIYPSGDWWETCWDNSGLVEDGDTAYFRVIAHDEYYLADTSSPVGALVDCQVPNAQLTIEDVVTTCVGIPKVAGSIHLVAVEDSVIQVNSLDFYCKLDSNPDVYQYWNYIGHGEQTTDNTWVYGPFSTLSLADNVYYDFRAVSTDHMGNVLFDFLNGDGVFDDSTFIPALAQGSGVRVFVDNQAPVPAISLVADTAANVYHLDPSTILGGTGKAYVQAGNQVNAEISVLPSQDTCEVKEVEWAIQVNQDWACVDTSADPYHYPVSFNPINDGFLPLHELEDGWWAGKFRALLHDSLGNSGQDVIQLYVLDIELDQAIIVWPLSGSCVSGDVDLKAAALNPYSISEVAYQHRHEDSTDWTEMPNGTSSQPDSFPVVWSTVDMADGIYFLRAVARDSLGIPDENPPTILVWVDVSLLRGDANGDDVIDLGDVVYLLNYLFKGDDPPDPLEAGDANCDGAVDLKDVVYLLNYLFKEGPPPNC